jgi:hypothetical protein
LRELRGNFCAQNSFWRPAVNPTGRLHCKKYISLGHKYFARVIRTKERGGLQFHRFFRELRGNFFVLKCILEIGSQSYREIALRKIYQSWA